MYPMFRAVVIAGTLMLFCLSVSAAGSGSALVADQLRCEGRINPLGVESPRPVLSWVCVSDTRNLEQSAYRILVASEPGLLVPGVADLWDSEKVTETAQRVSYGGKPLTSLKRVFWSVSIWNQEERVSDWSAPATWTMGVLRPEHWQAKWITGTESELDNGMVPDIVYRIINRTDCPGYGWMLREFGLQTLSERWDKPGSSLNHCMFGHAQEWFQGYVLGIGQEADSIGFEKLRIAPMPVGDLKEASGYYDSPRGRIAVAWHKSDKEFSLDLTVPGNTTATIVLPVFPTAKIMESGLPLDEVKGIQVIEKDANGWQLRVGSGEYQFVSKHKE